MIRSLLVVAVAWLAVSPAWATDDPVAVTGESRPGALALIENGRVPAVLTDPGDDAGILRAAADLRADLDRVRGGPGPVRDDVAVFAGTIGRHPVIDRLVREGRLDTTGVAGVWEASLVQIVDRPAPGIDRALVIAGADRRGTIFGIYGLSQAIGVSPWHWWADVPVARRDRLYLTAGRRIDFPRVRYRGIFINDEDPALRGWATATFGGFNRRFYARVFELILRSRGNFLWPAMWGKSLYEDDPASARLADEMGVVIGTSHHEPMMRAHVDWERHGEGPWDYRANAGRLRDFWREGLERTRGNEQLVTIGMRGDGDEPMTEGTATELLETIVRDQRRIIEEVSGRPAEETPQVWALYKEVQDYYDAGMRVPDDVTLLFSDDNWGNIRRLPAPGAPPRRGGSGVYYHFDYVGGPRNYKWLNTTQIERVWEQMNLAYAHAADRLWIVNVGDIKPMEFPISFFLDYAWNPDAWPLERLADYPRLWAARQFGEAESAAIGELLTRYARDASRRKPELLDASTYSLGGEWERVVAGWDALERDALAVRDRLPAGYRDAYFQLVLHPILANANVHRLYAAVARNHRAAVREQWDEAERQADEAERLFARDREIRRIYEEDIAGGKWTQMMSQTHIGYTGWQQPPADVMPAVLRRAGPLPAASATPGVPTGESIPIAIDLFSERVGDWRVIPNLGLYGAAVVFFPVTAPAQTPGGNGPHLAYAFDAAEAGEVELEVVLSPTLDFRGQGGLRFAVSIDDEPPRIVNVHAGTSEDDWERAVADNRWVRRTRHRLAVPGRHVFRLWAVDPGLVFQRLFVVRGTPPASYLGPPLPEEVAAPTHSPP